jgi:hypothetical protein
VTLVKNLPNVLMQQPRKGNQWRRLANAEPVYTDDNLLTLPGCRGEIRLANGLRLTLWGNVQEQVPLPWRETAVVLHDLPQDNPNKLDTDLTLSRGRIILANAAPAPLRVRVRFHRETWDLTLEPDGEIGMELWGVVSTFSPDDEPAAQLYLLALKGAAQVKREYREFALQAPPGPAYLAWNNVGGAPDTPRAPEPYALQAWTGAPPSTPQAEAMRVALEELALRLSDRDRTIEFVLKENRGEGKEATRSLAVLSLGAIDALAPVLDALTDPKYPDVRSAAVETLRFYLGRGPGQDKKLKDVLTRSHHSTEADTILRLLHEFPDRPDHATYEALISYLKSEKPTIRQLAIWWLVRLAPPDLKAPPYDPAAAPQQYERAADQWAKLLADGKLLPRPPLQPPPPKPTP